MAPLVSIAIPTFERRQYLTEAVASALAQTHPAIEVLVGDNSSGPAWDSPLARDPRVHYRRNPRNLGMSGNFNALADAARGAFLVAIGDDDRLLPEFVRRLVQEMTSDVRLVFCNHYLIDRDGRRLPGETRQHTQRYSRDSLAAGVLPSAATAAWQQAIAISATLLRTADMQRLRFREDLNTPDTEFFIRLAAEGGHFAFLPDYLAEYRVHGTSTTSSGLQSEALAEYLLPLEVTPDVEPYKRSLLGPLLLNAVGRCLQGGERTRAQRLLQSHYYPGPAAVDSSVASTAEYKFKTRLQRFCAMLPARIGCPAYRVLRGARDLAEWTSYESPAYRH